MGQANPVDLPDPPEPGASNAAAEASADDLLAQLAGEEVDRLLAEAEVDGSARAGRADDAGSHFDAPASIEPDLVLEAELRKAAQNEIEETLAPVTISQPASRASELTKELEADEAIHGKTPSIRDFSNAASTTSSSHDDDERPLPIYLRWLEWINFPVAMLPDSVQDLMGKIAILTLINAIAVLIYVVVFRKHQ